MENKHTLTGIVQSHPQFDSRILGNRRDVLVYLPPGYRRLRLRRRRYPVLYLHDGQNVFDAATSFAGVEWGVDETAQRLIRKNLIEPIIIVAIANTGKDRIHEYAPTAGAIYESALEERRSRGLAKKYGQFLIEELKPFIDQKYRTRSEAEFTGLGGSSMGGLLTLALGLWFPTFFRRLMWIEPRFWEHVAPYRFHHTPHVMANGVVQFGAGKQTHLQIDIDAPGGMDYTFIDKVLPFDRIAGQLLFTDDRLQILGLKGRLFSGDLAGSADISLAKTDRHYTAKIEVEKANFPRLTDLYFKYKTSQGDLSGRFDFTGVGSDSRLLKGEGLVKVTDGNVFAIPIFGPLSELVSKMFAGVGYSVAREATAPFTISQGVVHTDKLRVSGKLFAMLGHGDVDFLRNKLDFDIRIDAAGAGAVLTPIYNLFEYHGEGTLTKPIWRLKRF